MMVSLHKAAFSFRTGSSRGSLVFGSRGCHASHGPMHMWDDCVRAQTPAFHAMHQVGERKTKTAALFFLRLPVERTMACQDRLRTSIRGK